MLTDLINQAGHIRIYAAFEDQGWNTDTTALAAISGITIDKIGVDVPFDATHKLGTITLPTGLPKGRRYMIKLFNSTAAAASADDECVGSMWCMPLEQETKWFSKFNQAV